MERVLIGFIALVLLLMAVLPLFGFNLILVLGPAALEPFDPSVEPIYLFVGRSAGLATAAFFAVNFLRHRRPLTAAAPLLVYANFTLIFGLAYLVQTSSFQLIQFCLLYTSSDQIGNLLAIFSGMTSPAQPL